MKITLDEIKYWLFSNADQPSLARARHDIPLDIVSNVTEEEAKWICTKIREKLTNREFHEIYVKILVFFNDKSALDVLRELQQYYVEKHRVAARVGGGFRPWIRLLKDAIKHLESIQ